MSMFDFADNPGQARIMAERQIVPPPLYEVYAGAKEKNHRMR
jgi:hypothetical protein